MRRLNMQPREERAIPHLITHMPGPVFNATDSVHAGGMGAGKTAAQNATALQAVRATIEQNGGGYLHFPAGTFDLDLSGGRLAFDGTTYALDGLRISGAGPQTTVLNITGLAADTAQLFLQGDQTVLASTTLSATADPSDISLRVNSTTGFEAGQFIYIRDTTDVGSDGSWPYDPRADQDNGEWLEILAVDAGNSELDLVTSVQSSRQYAATATQVVALALTRNVTLENFTIQLGTVSNSYGGLSVAFINGLEIRNVEVIGAARSGISLSYCLNFRVKDVIIRDGDDGSTLTGYGIQTSQCQWGNIIAPVIRNQRRAIDYSGVWPTRYVYTIGGVCEGSYGTTDRSVVGTHGTAEYCGWIGTTIIGGGSGGGVYVRGNRITVDSCRFVGTHGGAVLMVDGARLTVTNCTMEGYKRWSTGSGATGRWPDYFVTVTSPSTPALKLSGNTALVETSYVRWNTTSNGELWIDGDQIEFRDSAPGTQDVVEHAAASGTLLLHLNAAAKGYDNLYRASSTGTITIQDKTVNLRQALASSFLPANVWSIGANATHAVAGTAQLYYPYLLFTNAQDSYATTWWRVPENIDTNIGVIVRAVWTVASASPSGNVVWRGYAVSLATGELVTAANSDSLSVTVAAPAQNAIARSSVGTIAAANLAAGDYVRVNIRRNGGEASDTSTDDARLLGIEMEYWTL